MHNMKVWHGFRVALEWRDDKLLDIKYSRIFRHGSQSLTSFLLEKLWVWNVFWGKLGSLVNNHHSQRSDKPVTSWWGLRSSSSTRVIYFRLAQSCRFAAGLAFLAFGFNLVDCGALLGHRLGSNPTIQPRAKKVRTPRMVVQSEASRTFTL